MSEVHLTLNKNIRGMLALNNNWPTIPLKELISKLFGSPLTLLFHL